jgi:hypothetical protein
VPCPRSFGKTYENEKWNTHWHSEGKNARSDGKFLLILSNPATIINMRSSMLVSPVVSTSSNSGYMIVFRSSFFVIHAAYNSRQSDYGKYSAFLHAIAYCYADICAIISVSTTWLLKSFVTKFFWDDLSWHHQPEACMDHEAEIRN